MLNNRLYCLGYSLWFSSDLKKFIIETVDGFFCDDLENKNGTIIITKRGTEFKEIIKNLDKEKKVNIKIKIFDAHYIFFMTFKQYQMKN